MSHGFELEPSLAPGTLRPKNAVVAVLAKALNVLNALVLRISMLALVLAAGVLTWSVVTRYFLKTSTGRHAKGLTLSAAAVLLGVIHETGGRTGLKVSGGIREAAAVARYLALADAIMGPDWVSPSTFRIGASALLDDLLALA